MRAESASATRSPSLLLLAGLTGGFPGPVLGVFKMQVVRVPFAASDAVRWCVRSLHREVRGARRSLQLGPGQFCAGSLPLRRPVGGGTVTGAGKNCYFIIFSLRTGMGCARDTSASVPSWLLRLSCKDNYADFPYVVPRRRLQRKVRTFISRLACQDTDACPCAAADTVVPEGARECVLVQASPFPLGHLRRFSICGHP